MSLSLFVYRGKSMGKISALRANKGRGRRVNVYLDGKFAFSVGAAAAKEGLRLEQDLSDERIETLTKRDRYERCLAAATAYLAPRPRSHVELKQRLVRRGFDDDSQQAVIAALDKQGMLDDSAFAQYWADNRESFSPRSRWMTRVELERKGVSREIIEKAVSTIDDEESAYRAAVGRIHSLRHADREQFSRRLGSYLTRRGFGYGVVKHTIEKVWKEVEHADSDSAWSNAD